LQTDAKTKVFRRLWKQATCRQARQKGGSHLVRGKWLWTGYEAEENPTAVRRTCNVFAGNKFVITHSEYRYDLPKNGRLLAGIAGSNPAEA